jgi:cell division topological specificity factor
MWFLHALKDHFGFGSGESAIVAKNRLKVVLTHDRVNLSPEDIQNLKKELVNIFSKYVELDRDSIDVSLTRSGNITSLVTNIPLKSRQKKGVIKKFDPVKKKRA